MNNIFCNPDWTFIINSISIAIGLIGLFFALKHPFKRQLGVISQNNFTLYEKIEGSIDIVRKIHKMEILFQNISKDILLKEYIVDGIFIDLGKAKKLKK